MKWIKHQTSTRRDEKIAQLIAKGGLASYGLYWAVQEIIAEQMDGSDPSCSVSYPISVWSHLLVTRGSLVFSTLSTLAVTGLVTVERHGDDVTVTNRKLLKYRDEYSRKSAHTPDIVRSDSGPEAEADTEADTEQKVQKQRLKPLARSVPPEELAGTLPLSNGTFYEISKTQIKEWTEFYPGVDVKQQCRSMKGWCTGNPTKLKTAKGILRFITSWLDREQNRANSGSASFNGGNGSGQANQSKASRNINAGIAVAQRLADRARANGHGGEPEGGVGREGSRDHDGAVIEGKF